MTGFDQACTGQYKKMKYWILTSEYPPYYGGGIGTYSSLLAQLLHKQQVNVSVFVPDRNVGQVTEEMLDGIRVIRFSPYYAGNSGFLGYEALVSYSFASVIEKYLAREEAPDWIEAQEYDGIAYYLLQKKHLGYPVLKDVKIIITCHCPSFILLPYNHKSSYTLPAYWIGEMEKFCIEAADICFSPSRYLVSHLHDAGITRQDIRVLPNPYEAKETYTGEVTALPDQLLFIGKVSPAKGIIELLDAIRALSRTKKSIRLDIIGDADFYLHSRKKIMSVYLKEKYPDLFNAGLVTLHGTMPAARVEQHIKQASLLVLPSKIENLPYVVLESMYLGTPVLASTKGGQAEIIEHTKNGFLYEPDEPNSLPHAIETILAMKAEDLSAISRNGAQHIARLCSPAQHYQAKMEQLTGFDQGRSNLFPFASVITDKVSVLPEKDIAQPLLSVIIPFYNLGSYLQETIDSIRKARYKNIEIIIVDDGSTDAASIQVLNELEGRPDLYIIRKPNEGLAIARNTGAAYAKGQFISFLDADDKVHADYYTKAVTVLMEKDNVHFAGSWIQYFEGSEKSWASFTPVFPYILFHNMINSSSLVYKKTSFCNYGLNDARFIYGMEDYDSVINMMSNGCYGVVLPERLFFYRVRKDSMSRGFNDTNQQYLYELIAKKHAATIAQFGSQLYGLFNANGPGYKIENPTKSSVNYAANGYMNAITRRLAEKVKRSPKIRSVLLKLMSKRG